MKTRIIMAVIMLGLALSAREAVMADPSTTVDGTDGVTLAVDCDAGTGITLGFALQTATPGSTILVSGTCQEAVTITTDDLTLDGQDRELTTLNGGGETAIAIDGARRITLMNLTVQNGFRGIRASNGASLLVDNVTTQNNAREGIRVDRNSTATFQGAITSNNNGDDGIIILENSSGVFDDATVQLNNNQGAFSGTNGINVTIASSAFFNGGALEANGNKHHGIAVRRAATIFLSDMENITTNDNGFHGISIQGGSDLLMNRSAQWNAANNGGLVIWTVKAIPHRGV